MTVHEFLARVVTDPGAHRAFAEEPLAALRQAGFGGLDSDQLRQVCSLALDCAPADVVELYRGSLRPALASCARPGQNVLATDPANHAAEIASLRAAPHLACFGVGGDVDSSLLGADPGVLSNGTEQPGAAAAGVPGLGGVADHVLPQHPVTAVPQAPGGLPTGQLPCPGPVVDHLPRPEPAPVAGVLPHGSEQLDATAGHLPVVDPPTGQLTLPGPTSNHPSGFADGYGVYGSVHGPLPVGAGVEQLPPLEPVAPLEPASSPLSGVVDGYGVNGPVESSPGGLPVAGDLAGQLPLHG